jgi:hypothetical protein
MIVTVELPATGWCFEDVLKNTDAVQARRGTTIKGHCMLVQPPAPHQPHRACDRKTKGFLTVSAARPRASTFYNTNAPCDSVTLRRGGIYLRICVQTRQTS